MMNGSDEMGKVLLFPGVKWKDVQKKSRRRSRLSRDEVLDRLVQLAWDNPEAFFWLKESHAMSLPVKIDDSVRNDLLALGLIDASGRELPEVGDALNAVFRQYAEIVAL